MLSNDTSSTNMGQPYRILLIEDDAHIAHLMLTSLSTLGLECHWAPDGESGLETFAEQAPHLVLLDMLLPGIDGREVCRKIRETSTVPIIMITALDDEENQLKSFKYGVDDYVPKPFNPKLLIARVVAQLRRVYRYDAENTDDIRYGAFTDTEIKEGVQNQDEKPVPPNWATCEACGYMGPRERFDKENWQGERFAVCPNCKQTEHIIFSIG